MKALLLVDMPINCGECKQRAFFHTGEHYCGVNGIDNEEWCRGNDNRPDWCPLRPLPERAFHPHFWDNGRYDKGWNECLDAIEGSDNEEDRD